MTDVADRAAAAGEALFALASRSLLAYYPASAAAVVDAADAACDAALRAAGEKERHYVERLGAAVAAAGLRPGGRPFGLGASYLNFVRSRVYARRAAEACARDAAAFAALAKDLPREPGPAGDLGRLAEDFAALRTEAHRSLVALAAEPPAAAAAAAAAPAVPAPKTNSPSPA